MISLIANTGQVVNKQSVEGLNSGQSKFFPDMTLGGLFYSKQGWFGVTAAHITQPNQSLVGSTDLLPMKISGHAGWKFYLTPGVIGQGFLQQAARAKHHTDVSIPPSGQV